MGLRLLSSHATNADGTLLVEPGIFELYRAMVEGRFRVFANLRTWIEEFRLYHRKEGTGEIMDRNDDLMSATRIGYLMRRHALPADASWRTNRPTRAQGEDNPPEGL